MAYQFSVRVKNLRVNPTLARQRDALQFVDAQNQRIRHTGPISNVNLVSVTSLAYKPYGQPRETAHFCAGAGKVNMPQDQVI